jgi:hypothetical protein
MAELLATTGLPSSCSTLRISVAMRRLVHETKTASTSPCPPVARMAARSEAASMRATSLSLPWLKVPMRLTSSPQPCRCRSKSWFTLCT